MLFVQAMLATLPPFFLAGAVGFGLIKLLGRTKLNNGLCTVSALIASIAVGACTAAITGSLVLGMSLGNVGSFVAGAVLGLAAWVVLQGWMSAVDDFTEKG